MGAGLTGTFDNPAGLALCLGLSLPFVRYLSESLNGSSTSRICVRALECLLVLGVLLSRSRTGLLCLLFYSLIVLCMQKKIRAGLKYTCVVVVCLAALFFVWNHKPDSTSGRMFIWGAVGNSYPGNLGRDMAPEALAGNTCGYRGVILLVILKVGTHGWPTRYAIRLMSLRSCGWITV